MIKSNFTKTKSIFMKTNFIFTKTNFIFTKTNSIFIMIKSNLLGPNLFSLGSYKLVKGIEFHCLLIQVMHSMWLNGWVNNCVPFIAVKCESVALVSGQDLTPQRLGCSLATALGGSVAYMRIGLSSQTVLMRQWTLLMIKTLPGS